MFKRVKTSRVNPKPACCLAVLVSQDMSCAPGGLWPGGVGDLITACPALGVHLLCLRPYLLGGSSKHISITSKSR